MNPAHLGRVADVCFDDFETACASFEKYTEILDQRERKAKAMPDAAKNPMPGYMEQSWWDTLFLDEKVDFTLGERAA